VTLACKEVALSHPLLENHFFGLKQDCQIFVSPNIPKQEKYTKIPQTIPKRPFIIPNDRKVYQHLPFQGPPKFTQIGIFGLKINRLANLF
jgi:hypothetical protein